MKKLILAMMLVPALAFASDFGSSWGAFFLRVASGELDGYSTMNKFGTAGDIDTGDDHQMIWDGNTVGIKTAYVWPTTASIDSISSSEDTDTVDMVVYGVDGDYVEVMQTVTLSGETRVALGTPLMRVFRAYNAGATGSDLDGNVYIYENGDITEGVPDDLTTVKAVVQLGLNQTLMALYTIPAGKTGYLGFGYVNLDRNGTYASDVRFWQRAQGGVFRIANDVALNSDSTSFIPFHYYVPIRIPEKTDMFVEADTTLNNTAVSAGFDIILVDN